MANIERIQKWHDALLSGDYAQTRGTLRDGKGFCCLGVACDISGLYKWGHNRDSGESYFYGDGYYALPFVVKKWLGLSINHREKLHGLIVLNDDGSTFEHIAEKIREFWPEVKFNG